MLKKLSLFLLLSFLPGCSNHSIPQLLWQAPIASYATPIVCNGTVYVTGFHAGHPGDPHRLFALDAATGQERWMSAEEPKEVYGESGGYVLLRNMAGHLVRLDAKTGVARHESSDALEFPKWVIRGDIIFVINNSQEAAAVDNRADNLLWRMKLPSEPIYQLDVQLAGQDVIVSGNVKDKAGTVGMIWALDAATGKEHWHFEAPRDHDYAPLEVHTHESYVLAISTSPLTLNTHVLDVHTGKELYPPIGMFDVFSYYKDTVYTSRGAFDLRTGKPTGGKAEWLSGSSIHNGVAWKRKIEMVGVPEQLLLRDTYDGDIKGKRNWMDTPHNSSLEGFDVLSGKSLYHTTEYKYTEFSPPVEANGVLFHTSMAVMKEGKSGVWAYKLP